MTILVVESNPPKASMADESRVINIQPIQRRDIAEYVAAAAIHRPYSPSPSSFSESDSFSHQHSSSTASASASASTSAISSFTVARDSLVSQSPSRSLSSSPAISSSPSLQSFTRRNALAVFVETPLPLALCREPQFVRVKIWLTSPSLNCLVRIDISAMDGTVDIEDELQSIGLLQEPSTSTSNRSVDSDDGHDEKSCSFADNSQIRRSDDSNQDISTCSYDSSDVVYHLNPLFEPHASPAWSSSSSSSSPPPPPPPPSPPQYCVNNWMVRYADDLAMSQNITPADYASFGISGPYMKRARRSFSDSLLSSQPLSIPPPPDTHPDVNECKTFVCMICQDENPIASAVLFGEFAHSKPQQNAKLSSSTSFCQHRFCRDCLIAYLQHEINDGKVLRLRCPGRNEQGDPCASIAPRGWLKRLLPMEAYAKYERFVQLKQDDSYRSCPNSLCLHVQQHHPLSQGQEMTCEKCSTTYCFTHDLAHVNSSCQEYAKRLKVESADSIQLIKKATVKCPWPTCRVSTEKESGCNHITCSQCNTHYCYLCGGFYFDGLHFSGWNLLGCPNMKNTNDQANSRYAWWKTPARIFIGIPLLLIFFAIVLSGLLLVESIFLVWLIGLAPLWIAYGLTICYYYDDHQYLVRHRHEERLRKCVTWGFRIVGCCR